MYPTSPNNKDLSSGDFQVEGTVPDTTPPTLNSVTINKNIGTSGDILTVTVIAQDDISGIGHIGITYDPPVGTQSKSMNLENNSNGTYSGNITIGVNDALGLWKVRYIGLYDKSGNGILVENKELYPTSTNSKDLSSGDFQVE